MKALIIKLIIVNMGAVISDVLLFALSGDNITSIVTALISLTGLIITVKIKTKVEKVDTKVDKYHDEVDGMKTALVEAVKGKGEAEGNLQGRIEQTQELQAAVKAASVTVTKDNSDNDKNK